MNVCFTLDIHLYNVIFFCPVFILLKIIRFQDVVPLAATGTKRHYLFVATQKQARKSACLYDVYPSRKQLLQTVLVCVLLLLLMKLIQRK